VALLKRLQPGAHLHSINRMTDLYESQRVRMVGLRRVELPTRGLGNQLSLLTRSKIFVTPPG